MLLTSEGLTAEVGEVGSWLAFDAGAYNLTVDGMHTYYVLAGSVPVLVHNDSGIDLSSATEWRGGNFPLGGSQDAGGPKKMGFSTECTTGRWEIMRCMTVTA